MPKRTCSIDECERVHVAHGLCDAHYRQQRRGLTIKPVRSFDSDEERFWSKVDKTETCWNWTASTTLEGYGKFFLSGRLSLAHRVSWAMQGKSIPAGMEMDHRCLNPSCVRPSHLRVVTCGQNMQNRPRLSSRNKSGVRGVSWSKVSNKWQATVGLNGENHHGGFFSSIEEADRAARDLRAKLFTHDDYERWITGAGH